MAEVTIVDRLLLNPAKTEVLWCSSARRQHQIPTGSVRIGNTSVVPVSVVRDFEVYIDADLTMSAHITATVRALRQIRSVRRSLTRKTLLTLLRGSPTLTTVLQHWLVYLVHSCSACSLCWMPLLDWCSLQGGQNTSRHFSVNCTGWKYRREYSFVCVFWRIVASMALRHRTLLRYFSRRLMYKDVVVSGLLRRRHSSYHRHAELPLVIVRFRLLRRVPGILFQLRSGKSSHCLRSAGNWRQHCLPSLFRQTGRDTI